MTDVNHQVSKALVVRYGAQTLFVLEDLTGIRTATERIGTRPCRGRFTSSVRCSNIRRPCITHAAPLYVNDDRIGAMNLHRLGIEYRVTGATGAGPRA